MTQKDTGGLILSGAGSEAAAAYESALHGYYCFNGDPMTPLQAAIDDSPGFVMAHVLTAYMTLGGTSPEVAAMGVSAYETARGMACTSHEGGHLAAVGAMIDGQLRTAGRILEDLSAAEPRDLLALQAGQLVDFLLGDSRMLRDRIGRALPFWSADMPHYHTVLGLMAFGLEETALYDRAEAFGREANELEPQNTWARHAVAHVLEMQDRRADGVAWMRGSLPTWSQDSAFKVHNWWHLALFHLGLGETEEVLRLYDGPIYGQQTGMAFDMLDAAALLWRLDLAGVDLGGRWERLADEYAGLTAFGLNAFEDFHAYLAFSASGRRDAAQAVLDGQSAGMALPTDNAQAIRDVGLPLMLAVKAFGEESYGEACALLREVRHRTHRFGGSHAQRDLVDLTLIEAARRGGDAALYQALLAERASASPLAGGQGARRQAA